MHARSVLPMEPSPCGLTSELRFARPPSQATETCQVPTDIAWVFSLKSVEWQQMTTMNNHDCENPRPRPPRAPPSYFPRSCASHHTTCFATPLHVVRAIEHTAVHVLELCPTLSWIAHGSKRPSSACDDAKMAVHTWLIVWMPTVSPLREGRPMGRLKPYLLRTCSAEAAIRSKSAPEFGLFPTLLRCNGIWMGSATASETRVSRGRKDEGSIIRDEEKETRKKQREAERRTGRRRERAVECCA